MDLEKWLNEIKPQHDRRTTVTADEAWAHRVGERWACREFFPLIEAACAVRATRGALCKIRDRIATEGTIGTLVSAETDLEYVMQDKLDALDKALRDLGIEP